MLRAVKRIAGTVIDSYVGTAKIKQDMKTAEMKAREKRLMLAAESDTEWRKIMANDTKHSLKDEYVLGIMSLPFIIFPFNPELTKSFFAGIQAAPDWWVWIFASVCLASFGLKAGPHLFNMFKK